ncbi:MAG: hybrid sensor histidine kinase/response regulator [Bacteroidota bacterium]
MEVNAEDKKHLILIVDDIPFNVKVVERTLARNGYNTHVARSGPEALEFLKDNDVSLILLDIMMPGMDGYELARIIKSDNRLKEIPIIFLTARTESDDMVKAYEAGASDFMPKPFNITEILLRVKNHLQLREALKQNKIFIEELQKKNTELEIAKKELNEHLQSKDRFFSIIANDLKNPFQGLLGLAELLNNNYDEFDEADKKDIIRDIDKSAENLYKLLENLLAWSKIQMGKMKYNPESHDLLKLVKNNIDLIKPLADKKNINIINGIKEEITAYYDVNMIDTVIRNLLNNAIKFTGKNGKIQIEAATESAYVDLTIQDNGVGMSEEDIKRIFKYDDHFSRPGTEDEPGSGLGLILCRDLLELNKGLLIPESSPGKGSKFTVRLPLKG